jgi:hypothetical protein
MGKIKSVIIGDNEEITSIPAIEIADGTHFNEAENKDDNSSEIIEKKTKLRIVKQYLFPPAGMGEMQTTIHLAGQYWILKIIDKIYTPDAKIMKHYDVLNTYLLTNGFVDCSQSVQVGETEETITKIKRIYKVGHPDNSPSVRKNGDISLRVDEEDIHLKCVKGIVTTDKKKIYDTLISQGWYEAGIETLEVK